jgi:hypothetical protein
MQAIVTKYLSPTNYRGTRIKVSCAAKTITVGWNHALDVEANHREAAIALKVALGWVGPQYGQIHGGTMKNGDFCWVMVPEVSR